MKKYEKPLIIQVVAEHVWSNFKLQSYNVKN